MQGIRTTVAAVALCAALALPAGAAEEPPKPDLRSCTTVKTALQWLVNGQATLLLRSGQEISGTVLLVGDGVVYLSRVTGREFYDAVISLDQVTGVVVRVRGK